MANILGLVSVWTTDNGPGVVVFAQTGRCPVDNRYCYNNDYSGSAILCARFTAVDTEDGKVIIRCGAATEDDVDDC